MTKPNLALVEERARPSYWRDDEICTDLAISPMTLSRMRKRGTYPQPVKFSPGGPNRTPDDEHQRFKADRQAEAREIPPARRAAGLKLADEHVKWLERQPRRGKPLSVRLQWREGQDGENPERDPEPRPRRPGKATAGPAPARKSGGGRRVRS